MKRYRDARALLVAGVGAFLLALWSALAVADRQTFAAEPVAVIDALATGTDPAGTVEATNQSQPQPQPPEVKQTHTRTRAS
jgi:hypothetical protein